MSDVMMSETLSSARALVDRLRASGAELWVDSGALKFRAPRGVIDEASRSAMADQREAIIQLLSATTHASVGAKRSVVGARGEGVQPPLSFAQRRFWFLDQFDPGAPHYNIGAQLMIRDRIDVEILRQAVDDLFDRHEVFRTRIETLNGAPRLEIMPRAAISLEVVDLSGEPALDREAVSRAQGEDALRTRFDMAAGRLALMRLIRFAADDARLFFVAHHAIADGYSLDLVWRDLGALTAARRGGAQVTPLQVQYGDFAAWEQASVDDDGFAQDAAFWRQELADAPVLLELPADRPRGLAAGAHGARYAGSIDLSTIQRLQEVARSNGVTLFVAMLAVWQALLSKLSGQEDVIVGAPIAARDDQALEKVIGCFINNVPLRGDLSGAPPFTTLLKRTKEMTARAFRHGSLPFEKVVEAVNPPRTAAHAPIFQTLFTLMNFRSEDEAPASIQWAPIEADTGAARFDLSLEISQQTGAGHKSYLAAYEYDADLFDEATIVRLHAQYMRLLHAAVQDPDAPLVAASLLSPEEASIIAESWNATDRPFDRTRTTSDLITLAASERPDAVAVQADDGSLTYAAFEARANQIAQALAARGAGPAKRVAVCLNRTKDLPATLAAVWKTGAAYVPLDPTHPAERLGLVLADAEVACVATTSEFAHLLGEAPVLLLDDGESLSAFDDGPVATAATPEGLAYLIYTSGSTGKPKGVEVGHAALAAFLEAMRQEPGLAPGEALLAVTTPSFDIAGLEFWLPLTTGGLVVIASEFDVVDGGALAGLLEAHDVRLLQATPTTWRLLLEEGWGGKPDLTALCGGEALPLDLAEALLPRVQTLWNVYGPTETTVWSTIHRVTPADLGLGRIPVGRPIANTRVYVLEPTGGLAAIGAPGELVIAGEGVAAGYRHLAELTTERFVEIAPLGRRQRAYRTGDLARWRANGVLDLIGRSDGQVKVRGFRIELGEIEAALTGHPAVRQACVTVSNTNGGATLVAYLIYDAVEEPTTSELRRYLRRLLPDYMTPALFIAIDAVPRSASGKVDRRRLPDPFRTGQRANRSSEPLAPGLETEMGRIWSELLETERVGPGDNFFELGGHSLLSMRVAAAFQRRTGLRLDPRALFFQTLGEVVAGIERGAAQG